MQPLLVTALGTDFLQTVDQNEVSRPLPGVSKGRVCTHTQTC